MRVTRAHGLRSARSGSSPILASGHPHRRTADFLAAVTRAREAGPGRRTDLRRQDARPQELPHDPALRAYRRLRAARRRQPDEQDDRSGRPRGRQQDQADAAGPRPQGEVDAAPRGTNYRSRRALVRLAVCLAFLVEGTAQRPSLRRRPQQRHGLVAHIGTALSFGRISQDRAQLPGDVAGDGGRGGREPSGCRVAPGWLIRGRSRCRRPCAPAARQARCAGVRRGPAAGGGRKNGASRTAGCLLDRALRAVRGQQPTDGGRRGRATPRATPRLTSVASQRAENGHHWPPAWAPRCGPIDRHPARHGAGLD